MFSTASHIYTYSTFQKRMARLGCTFEQNGVATLLLHGSDGSTEIEISLFAFDSTARQRSCTGPENCLQRQQDWRESNDMGRITRWMSVPGMIGRQSAAFN